jgi:hypothetical protein
VVWEPRWRALARRFGAWRTDRRDRGLDAGDLIDGAPDLSSVAPSDHGGGGLDVGDSIVAAVVGFVVFVVAAALFWWVLLPLLLVVLDVVIVLVLLALSVVGRVLFRRPWTVEAAAEDGERVTARVVGWRAALRRRDEMAHSLRHGLRTVDVAGPLGD